MLVHIELKKSVKEEVVGNPEYMGALIQKVVGLGMRDINMGRLFRYGSLIGNIPGEKLALFYGLEEVETMQTEGTKSAS